MSNHSSGRNTIERRLANLTVEALRNYCDINGISGISNLKKNAMISAIAKRAEGQSLEEFLSYYESDYLLESFRKAVKWGKNDLIVRLDPRSKEKELHAEFNGLDIGLKRVYYVDFYNVTNPKQIITQCECADSSKKGLFCPHQMTVLLRALSEGIIRLGKWCGPMTPEVREAIASHMPRIR